MLKFSIYLFLIFSTSSIQPHKIFISASEPRTFEWITSNQLTDPENWLNSDLACDGDYIRTEQRKLSIALIDSRLKVDAFDLPDDGVLYFGDNGMLGEKGNWQCNKRKSREGV